MWKIDATEIEELADRIAQTGEQAEKIINDVLHNYAGQEIISHVTPLIPESGRTWKGKKKPAKVSQPFREEQGNLYVVVKTKHRIITSISRMTVKTPIAIMAIRNLCAGARKKQQKKL